MNGRGKEFPDSTHLLQAARAAFGCRRLSRASGGGRTSPLCACVLSGSPFGTDLWAWEGEGRDRYCYFAHSLRLEGVGCSMSPSCRLLSWALGKPTSVEGRGWDLGGGEAGCFDGRASVLRRGRGEELASLRASGKVAKVERLEAAGMKRSPAVVRAS